MSATTRQVRTALAASELRYRRLFESAQDGILILDAETGMVVDVNPFLTALLGYSHTEFLGKKVWELGFFRNIAANEDKFRELQARDYVRYEDMPLETAAGRKIDVEFVSNVYLVEGKRVIQCNIRDISDRVRAASYQRMNHEILRILNEPSDLAHTMQAVIATLKAQTTFDAVGIRLQNGDDFPYYYQDGFAPEFLETENTLIERDSNGGVCRDKDGNICLECICGLVLAGQTDPANKLFTRGGSFWTNDSASLLHIPANDDPRRKPRNECIHQGYASVALVPIRNRARTVGLIQFNDRRKGCFTPESVAQLEDIAAHIGSALMRKQAETEADRLAEQLRQAQKMEAVGRLAGGVAHDFNNLLMGIMGYTELCRDVIEPGHPIRKYLDEITNGANRSAEIIRQLLAFARKQIIAPRILDLNDAVEAMLKLLQQLIHEDIKLIWRPGANLRPVKLDPSQIDQILTNLCVNARDAIAGVGEITLETGSATVDAAFCASHPEATPGVYEFLAVSDNGCGMDNETLAQVFEPFFTTKGVGEGSGLGLATVYGIVKQNNGFINVYSEPGKGTTFKIYLPAMTTEAAKTPVASRQEAPRGRGETVLLAEDEKSLRVTCGLFLEALGYKVLAAATPAEALKLIDRHPGEIHVLLTDVVMPGMDGRQLAQRISALKPGVKVLFMSGYTSDVIAQRGVLDEGVQFLSKPFSRDDLARKVRAVLDEVRMDQTEDRKQKTEDGSVI